jgi:hypothetical protein
MECDEPGVPSPDVLEPAIETYAQHRPVGTQAFRIDVRG